MMFKTILEYSLILQCMRVYILYVGIKYYIKIEQAAQLGLEKQCEHNAHTK